MIKLKQKKYKGRIFKFNKIYSSGLNRNLVEVYIKTKYEGDRFITSEDTKEGRILINR